MEQGTILNEQTGLIISVTYTASSFSKQVKVKQNKLSEEDEKNVSPIYPETSGTPRNAGGNIAGELSAASQGYEEWGMYAS